MKKLTLILFITHYSLLIVNAQQPTLEWVRKYPDTTNNFYAFSEALAVDSAGNVYIAGGAGTAYWSAYCTVKYSPSGLKLWSAIYYGQSSGGRIAWAIAVDRAGNVYVTGYSYRTGFSFDYCTIKYNSNGIQQWVQYYNGPSNGDDEAHAIGIDNAGNIYITGFSALQGQSSFQVTTIKYSPDGTELWVRRYGTPSSLTVAKSMAIDNDCNIYITGSNNFYALTMKYDSSGSQRWVQEYQGRGFYNESNSIWLDNYNNVFVAGASPGPSSWYDFFTIKYSAGGVQQWVRRYNPDSMNTGSWYWASSVVADAGGNVYVSGYSRSNNSAAGHICIVKYSGAGNLIWALRDSGGVGALYNTYMDIDKNNDIYIAYDKADAGDSIACLKFDSSGMFKWQTLYNDTAGYDAIPSSLKVDNNFNVHITGSISTSISVKMYTIKYSQVIGITPISSNIPNEFKLYQNYPNPFNVSTKFKVQISKLSHVRIIVYDVLGRTIAALVNEELKPGTYEIQFDGTNFSSGVYFYRMETQYFTEIKKMVLLK